MFCQEDPFEPILRQLSEPPMSSAVAAVQPARQGSYFRRQASLPFPTEAQATAPAGVDPALVAAESQRGVVERLVPDYDWEQDAMSGAVFNYHFSDVTDLASVVNNQVKYSPLVITNCKGQSAAGHLSWTNLSTHIIYSQLTTKDSH